MGSRIAEISRRWVALEEGRDPSASNLGTLMGKKATVHHPPDRLVHTVVDVLDGELVLQRDDVELIDCVKGKQRWQITRCYIGDTRRAKLVHRRGSTPEWRLEGSPKSGEEGLVVVGAADEHYEM